MEGVCYVILWACEDLPDSQYDVGIIVGYANLMAIDLGLLPFEALKIHEKSKELVMDLPFGKHLKTEDFQKAHLHYGIFCDPCQHFQCI
ncbi:hypothetical protein DMENIID0001_056520 [Sergentomyia squamirostris]